MARGQKRRVFKRAPKADEYVIWRNKKGRIVKPRGGVYLIGEIRNRKTKKTTGYLNSQNKETKLPNYQRFTSIQRAILTTPKKIASTQDRLKRSLQWVMTSRKPIIEQIPQRIVTAVNREISLNDEALVAIEIESRTGRIFKMRTDARYFNRKVTKDEIAAMIAIDILQILNSEMVRMSPKQKSNDKQSRRRHISKLHCTLIFVSFI